MRRVAVWLFRLVLRVFFRHIELAGIDRLPATGAVVLTLNHPSALVDPLFVLTLLPRPAAFLAKAPLFRIPVIGNVVRAFDSIPVERRQDPGADLSRNRQMFEAARNLLVRGGLLALFPEGASHDDPKLRPLRTGAARIALSAASPRGPMRLPVEVVPAGLTFNDKGRFRSDALLGLGEPIAVPSVDLDPAGEPPAEAVRELTRHIERGLAEVTLQSEQQEALELATQAERVFSSADPELAAGGEPLSRQVDLRRRLLRGRALLRSRAPARLARLERRVERYESVLRQAALEPGWVRPERLDLGTALHALGRAALAFALLFPAAALGAAVHAPAYALTDVLARRLSRGDRSMLATLKVLAALVLYPLTWAALGIAAGWRFGLGTGLLVPLAAGGAGYAAVRFSEEIDRFLGFARVLGLFLLRRGSFERLARERDGIRREILELAELVEEPSPAVATLNSTDRH